MALKLNERAWKRCCLGMVDSERLRVRVSGGGDSAQVVDCGVAAAGGLEAGLWMAETCLAGLARIQLGSADPAVYRGPAIEIHTDQPVAACMASQYAGWQIVAEGYFAMGSGPMRAACGREELFDRIGCREQSSCAVGVLESSRLPPPQLSAKIAQECGVAPAELILLVARTASLAGTIQVVARSVETCLHKLLEVGFDLACVASAFGTAPLPPVAEDDLAAVGRTNDAILYGGQVTLWVDGDWSAVEELGPGVPSVSSADYGQPFAEVFERYHRDFYRIDPLLFSPALVTFHHLRNGRTLRFGELRPDILRRSFGDGAAGRNLGLPKNLLGPSVPGPSDERSR